MKKYIVSLILLCCSSVFAFTEKGAYALYDHDAMNYVVSYNQKDVRSIASITKLFTANAVIRSGVDLNEKIKVNGKSRGKVPTGIYMSRIDLMRAMIISSDNRAAETLANHHPGGFNKFIYDVNEYNQSHALYDTRIVDSTGLLPGNTSTARDLIEFLFQIKDNDVIRSIAHEREAKVSIPKGKKNISINFHNTNPDLFVYDNILISKTGFTNPAGRCVLMLVEQGKRMYTVVVLGQPTPKTRSKVVGTLLVNLPKDPKPKINATVEYSDPL